MDEQKSQKEDEEAKVAPPVKGGSGNKFILIGILVGVILLNSVIAFLLIKATKPENEEQKNEKMHSDSLKHAQELATAMGATTEEPIEAVVNIAGTDGKRFLKAAIIFEYDNVAFPILGEELARRAPKFKNLLINHLSRQTLTDLTDLDAKEKLRKDLLRLINATIPPEDGEVREVLFTTYIIQ
jgi:flagellar basal body-associated protein FliL